MGADDTLIDALDDTYAQKAGTKVHRRVLRADDEAGLGLDVVSGGTLVYARTNTCAHGPARRS